MNTTRASGRVERARHALVAIAWVTTAACTSQPADRVVTDAAVARDASRAPETSTHSLAVSPTHACVVRKAGVYCWGENFVGQLGNGGTTTSEQAVEATVVGNDIVEIAAATGRTCIRTSTGKVECWGSNDHGQIGDGTRTDTLVPVAASGIDDAIQLALDDVSTCVLRKAGRTVACWGGGPEDAWLPRQIEGLSNVQELRAGSDGSYCARDASNTVWCWQSGNGAWAAAKPVEALAGARTIALAGFGEVCALIEAGNVVCNSSDSGLSVALDDSDGAVTLIGAGGLALCANKRDGSWYCWNVLRQMLESVGSPAIALPTEPALTELLISGFHVCAVREDRQVVCANANDVLVGASGVDASALKIVAGLPD